MQRGCRCKKVFLRLCITSVLWTGRRVSMSWGSLQRIFRGGGTGSKENMSQPWHLNLSAPLTLLSSHLLFWVLLITHCSLNKDIILHRYCHKQHNNAHHVRDAAYQIRSIPQLSRHAHTWGCRQVLARGCFWLYVCGKTLWGGRTLWNLSLWLLELTWGHLASMGSVRAQ